MKFEIRLEGGNVFHMGYLTGLLGRLMIIRAPDFCRIPDFPGCIQYGGRGTWNVRPIDEYALGTVFGNQRQLCRRVDVTARTPGAGLIYFSSDAQVDVYLSVTEFAASGLSVYEDWIAILKANKDDPSKMVLLSMEFGTVTPEEINHFRDQGMLATKDIELNVRPMAIS
jgi:hypothetical protein